MHKRANFTYNLCVRIFIHRQWLITHSFSVEKLTRKYFPVSGYSEQVFVYVCVTETWLKTDVCYDGQNQTSYDALPV